MPEQDDVLAGFEIGGGQYPLPVVATFDMDEAEILWGYCGCGLEDLVPDADGAWSEERNEELLRMLKNPSFRRTLLHVAYRRGNPDATRQEIEKQIGKVSNLAALAAWAAQFQGDDASPPAQESTSTPNESSSSELVDSSKSSGNGSSTTSTEQVEHPDPTGATR